MAATWDHAQLGRFTYDGTVWINTVSMPAFKAFAYDTGYPNAPRSTGDHELAFEADNKRDVPSPAAVALAEKVLANQHEIVSKVTEALWDDFNGRDPSSDMWWHGDLQAVADAMGAGEPPRSASDVLALMQLSRMTILKRVEGYEEPVVELSFHAAFEEEHGVGILTDGKEILGIDYTGDVFPFNSTG
jgi:hypothetical protein